jgi:hypothetical protein
VLFFPTPPFPVILCLSSLFGWCEHFLYAVAPFVDDTDTHLSSISNAAVGGVWANSKVYFDAFVVVHLLFVLIYCKHFLIGTLLLFVVTCDRNFLGSVRSFSRCFVPNDIRSV